MLMRNHGIDHSFSMQAFNDETEEFSGGMQIHVRIRWDVECGVYFDLLAYDLGSEKIQAGYHSSVDRWAQKLADSYYTTDRLNEIVEHNDEFIVQQKIIHRDLEAHLREFRRGAL